MHARRGPRRYARRSRSTRCASPAGAGHRRPLRRLRLARRHLPDGLVRASARRGGVVVAAPALPRPRSSSDLDSSPSRRWRRGRTSTSSSPRIGPRGKRSRCGRPVRRGRSRTSLRCQAQRRRDRSARDPAQAVRSPGPARARRPVRHRAVRRQRRAASPTSPRTGVPPRGGRCGRRRRTVVGRRRRGLIGAGKICPSGRRFCCGRCSSGSPSMRCIRARPRRAARSAADRGSGAADPLATPTPAAAGLGVAASSSSKKQRAAATARTLSPSMTASTSSLCSVVECGARRGGVLGDRLLDRGSSES